MSTWLEELPVEQREAIQSLNARINDVTQERLAEIPIKEMEIAMGREE